MGIKPENLLKHELIGLKIEVLESSDKSQIGLSGQVINETQNTLTLQTVQGEKTVPKKGSVFKVFLEHENVKVKGEKLLKTPQERIKTMVKKW
jgi:ribonuclease P protein subunit POP4